MSDAKKKLWKSLLRAFQGVVTAFANYAVEEYGIALDGVKKSELT